MIEISRLKELCTHMDIMVEKSDEDHYFCNCTAIVLLVKPFVLTR